MKLWSKCRRRRHTRHKASSIILKRRIFDENVRMSHLKPHRYNCELDVVILVVDAAIA